MLTIILAAWADEIYINMNLNHGQNQKRLQNTDVGGLSMSLSTYYVASLPVRFIIVILSAHAFTRKK